MSRSAERAGAFEPTAAQRNHARALWRFTGDVRPPFADVPAPGQESVWDFPRPPALRPEPREVVLRVGDTEIARSTRAWRLCETASPPTIYVPFADARRACFLDAGGGSFCEWKGGARYHTLVVGETRLERVGWSYPEAMAPYQALADCVSVYPAHVACTLGGEPVRPQDGGFYGGWVTADLAGPWKGGPGTSGW